MGKTNWRTDVVFDEEKPMPSSELSRMKNKTSCYVNNIIAIVS